MVTNATVGGGQSITDLIYGENPNTATNPNFGERAHRIYRNPSAAGLTVNAGGYLVVGPRTDTFIGSKNMGAVTIATRRTTKGFILQRIRLMFLTSWEQHFTSLADS